MASAGIGTWIALISCPLFSLLILVVLFRADSGARKKKRPAAKERPQAAIERANPPREYARPAIENARPPKEWPQAGGGVPVEVPKPAKPPKQIKGRKQAIELGDKPDCVQLRIAAQQLASAAGSAVLAARAAARDAAQVSGELARLTAVRDGARQKLDNLREAISRAKAALAVPGEQAGEDSAAREVAQRAALAAYKRGDISVDEMQAVWRRVGGWDDKHEESEKELIRLRAEEAEARKELEAADAALGPARRRVQAAEAVARARSQEAVEADQAARAAYAAAANCR